MNTQKFLVSGIVGGIVCFFAGYLIYGLAMADFFSKNAGTATGVMKPMGEMVWWALIAGSIFNGLTLSYIYNKLTGISSLAAGAGTGFVLGVLITAGFDLTMFGTANLMNLQGTLVDIVCGGVMFLITGAAVGLMNGVGKKTTA